MSGVYTACETCEENPDKPLTWQVKSTRIIYDQKDQMVYYRGATLEFFGVPLIYLPVFAHADPTADRKSGFLPPRYLYSSRLGVRLGTPYYFALDPSYDLTLTPVIHSRQGIMADALWRQRLINGSYSIRASGIRQQDQNAF